MDKKSGSKTSSSSISQGWRDQRKAFAEELAAELQGARQRLSLSLRDVAELVGVHYSTLSRIESKKRFSFNAFMVVKSWLNGTCELGEQDGL